MGFDITPNAGTTLRKVLKLEIAPHMEMFEGISAAATKVRDGVQSIENFGLLVIVCNLFLMNGHTDFNNILNIGLLKQT